jgi:aryl-phospho-beta-D-glucosidase BglC (GH1 family)
MAALAKIDWASRLNIASVIVLDKFQNDTYFRGVQGLQNYGALNDPLLHPAVTPGIKVAGNGNVWVTPAGVVNATANEVFADIQTIFIQLVNQTGGLITSESKLVMAMSPQSQVALTATNQYNVNVYDQLKKNFPNIRFENAVQYATTAGQLVQMFAEDVDGQEFGYVSFTEKLRAHTIVKEMSAFKQKKSQGTWGFLMFFPAGMAQMIGV